MVNQGKKRKINYNPVGISWVTWFSQEAVVHLFILLSPITEQYLDTLHFPSNLKMMVFLGPLHFCLLLLNALAYLVKTSSHGQLGLQNLTRTVSLLSPSTPSLDLEFDKDNPPPPKCNLLIENVQICVGRLAARTSRTPGLGSPII